MARWAEGRHFFNAYGPTEATVCASIYQCRASDSNQNTLSLGQPLPNTQLYLLDRHQQLVPPGVTGEIYLGGVGLARGYWHHPDLTAERFVPHPFAVEAGACLYRTGDLARFRSDGSLEWVGRKDQQVKLRGYRIEPGEIEAVLSEHEAVQECVVVKREETSGKAQLVAYMVGPSVEQARRLREPEQQLELWPSVAEFYVYDELLYRAMINDERRNQSYRAAARLLVKDKVVLDIGTGSEAILAQMCVEEGARRVYAVEMLEDVYQRARATVERLGLEDRIILIHGDIVQVQLPERVDVCISEIVGAIGGAEGVACILNRTRHLLKQDGIRIPQRSTTHIAAVCLPDEMAANPGFTDLSAHYVEKIFEQVGCAFDLRVCVKGLTPQDLLSDMGIFEDLDFRQETVELEYEHRQTLTIQRDGQIDGFLVWLHLQTVLGEEIDILEHPHSWLPVYFPVFYPGIEVCQGERIHLTCSGKLCENGVNLDYKVEGSVIRRNNEILNFCYEAPHYAKAFRGSPFYQMIFSERSVPRKKENRQDTRVSAANEMQARLSDIRSYLQDRLPAYMIPSALVQLDTLPLTPNGKVDRQALPAPDFATQAENEEASALRTPEEVLLGQIWVDVLSLDTGPEAEQIGARSNFFRLGGHSLLAIQLLDRINDCFGISLPLPALFQFPTIAQIAPVVQNLKREAHQRTDIRPVPSLVVPLRTHLQEDQRTAEHLLVPTPLGGGSPLPLRKPPFFFVHPASGDLYSYLNLLRYLPQDRAYYGIQAQGLTDTRESLIGIEKMATVYIEALLEAQPVGPYLLGGHSVGGLIALEMARLLQSRGQDVALLVLIDSMGREQGHLPPQSEVETFDETQWLIDMAELLERTPRQAGSAGLSHLRLSYDELHRLHSDEREQALLKQLKAMQMVPQETEIELFRKQLRIIRANMDSQRLYSPLDPYKGDLVLFCCEERTDDPRAMWQPLVTGRLSIQTVPGDHFSMMNEPFVQSLAVQLQRYLP
jgi:thioesterase domain-containing protein/precorrin-6B methylase 2/acyl carrier protein